MVASIETDERSLFDSSLDPEPIWVDVTVNSPKAGKIVDLLLREEDTGPVVQDLFALDGRKRHLHKPWF